ncbi:TRAP transporter small permease subunit [Ramlibacter sp. MAH-25]|uniref:TRAP transporter small permease protein n=2 Tax=Comamonadaceae TaxID=80864 RepID=A0A6N8J1M4_9BURK|nr:TRAP transporter small permease subunit [Ramlibacter pinisoli]
MPLPADGKAPLPLDAAQAAQAAGTEGVPAAAPASWYTRLCRAIARGCMWLGIAGIVALICAVTWQVFGRYVLNSTPTWAESLALLLVLYVTMLGTAVGVRDAGHIGLESFLVLAPEALRLKMEYLIQALILIFGAAMAWNCAYLVHSVWTYRLPTLGISEGWKYVPAAVCGALMVLFSIEHLIALAQGREVEPAWQ